MNDQHDDDKLFKEAMKGVKPLKSKNKAHFDPPKPKVKPRQGGDDEFWEMETKALSDHYSQNVTAEQRLLFTRSGLQPKQLKRLQRGEFSIQATLDLHGKTTELARAELCHFLGAAHTHALRHVLIIHGKGYRSGETHPHLKNLVNIWLRQFDEVLGFCSAAPKDGGTGAVYVLLRR